MNNFQKGVKWRTRQNHVKIAPIKFYVAYSRESHQCFVAVFSHESLFESLKWVWTRLQIKHPTAAETNKYMDDLEDYSGNPNTTESTE